MKPADMKTSNKKLILNYFYNNETVARPDLVGELGLSKPTVSMLVGELQDEGYLLHAGEGDTGQQGGKRPQLYTFNALCGTAVAVNIGVARIQGALTDMRLNSLKQIDAPYSEGDPQQAFTAMVGVIGELLEEASAHRLAVFGIGVSAPGIVRSESGVLVNSARLRSWGQVPLKSRLEEQFRLPVRVDNAPRNIALAEKWAGLGKHLSTFITLQADGGLGTGIFLDGKIYKGADESGGEFGHTTVDMNGPPCRCGNRGCWELYGSDEAFMKRVADGLELHSDSMMAGAVRSGARLDLPLVAECVARGDRLARQLVEEYADGLSVGLVNLVNVFNPEWIILQGQLRLLGPDFLRMVTEKVKERALYPGSDKVRIGFSGFAGDTKLIGAAALVVKEVMEGKYFRSVIYS
jgi:predicted NBD/HSP70 family sugar kinase